MPTERHFNIDPWIVVAAEDQSQQPYIFKFATEAKAIKCAEGQAYRNCAVYHVFKVERVASVHSQPAKVYRESRIARRDRAAAGGAVSVEHLDRAAEGKADDRYLK